MQLQKSKFNNSTEFITGRRTLVVAQCSINKTGKLFQSSKTFYLFLNLLGLNFEFLSLMIHHIHIFRLYQYVNVICVKL